MTCRLAFVHALSPLHAGTGQSVGAVELAIARDRATGFPYLPGSSLKGALRDRTRDRDRDPRLVRELFGPDTTNASEHAGALAFGDANLLLFPVRSVAGTFAWTTSPYLLDRFARDCSEARAPVPPHVQAPASCERCRVARDAVIRVGERVIFEDLDFTYDADTNVAALAAWLGDRIFAGEDAWKRSLASRLAIVHDDTMTFLAQHATDIVARVSIDDATGAAKGAALWHEENLPTETILVSLVAAMPNEKTRSLAPDAMFDELDRIVRPSIQLGGKATVGRGRCRVVFDLAARTGGGK
ncbi:MAG: type III-B CRISPR module RAMP protein Cmr4 [Deltaproteobacteria bacterium]|nr:type III-B CRISPR module RAMP protein Cmr4 [Deltaproteobacteria bacterium]